MIRLGILVACLLGIAGLIGEVGHAAWGGIWSPADTVVSTSGRTRSGDSESRRLVQDIELPTHPISSFPLTATDPVFFEGRRYPKREAMQQAAAVSAPPPKPVFNIDGVRLQGIFMHDAAPRALIEVTARPATWVGVGDVVQAWTVASINHNSVRLIRDSQVAVLELYGFSTAN